MGDMVNLAARLMAAAGPDQVYVDEATMQQTENYMEYSVSGCCKKMKRMNVGISLLAAAH